MSAVEPDDVPPLQVVRRETQTVYEFSDGATVTETEAPTGTIWRVWRRCSCTNYHEDLMALTRGRAFLSRPSCAHTRLLGQ